MSVDAYYTQITLEEYIEVFQKPELIDKFFGYLDIENKQYAQRVASEGRFYTLGTQWQAMHFLLTGEVAEPRKSQITSPLSMAVMGKHPFPHQEWADTVFYLTPNEVKAIAIELTKYSPEQIEKNFEVTKHPSIRVYRTPPIEEWSEYQLQSLMYSYTKFQEFYIKAAKNNNAVLVWIG